jgi:hypothetical protein
VDLSFFLPGNPMKTDRRFIWFPLEGEQDGLFVLAVR